MSWSNFHIFAAVTIIFYTLAAISMYKKSNTKIVIFVLCGILTLTVFIAGFWVSLQRPPMRTMGETRLWYSFFLAVCGVIAYKKWVYNWLLLFTLLLSTVFMFINILKPEIHSKALMPALQSYYFIPHVSFYILSYSILGVATIASVMQINKINKNNFDKKLEQFTDNIIYIGFGFLMLGLLTGAAWAKKAWGHYWSWDPKETWALITACAYLIYIHMRLRDVNRKLTLIVLPIAFIFLMMAWFGVSYLPSTQNSVHVYS